MENANTASTGRIVEDNTGTEHMSAPEVIVLNPENAQDVTIVVQPGTKYLLDFDPSQITAATPQNDGSLVIEFRDNSKIVLENFSEAVGSDENPATLVFGDQASRDLFLAIIEASQKDAEENPQAELRQSQEQNADAQPETNQDAAPAQDTSQEQPLPQEVAELVDELLADNLTAEQLAAIEPAAGPTAAGGSSSGYGFNSSVDGNTSFNTPDITGPIGATALSIAPFAAAENPVVVPVIAAVGAPTASANNGVDQVQVYEDGSIGVNIRAALSSTASSDEFLVVRVTGINSSWGTLSSTVGTYNPATGVWRITLAPGQDLDTVLTFTPNANRDADLSNLTLTVTAVDPVSGQLTTSTDSFFITTDAVADAVDIDAQNIAADEGMATALNVTTTASSDTDGSESITHYQISGVPAGFTFSAGTDLGGGIWQFTPAQFAGLTVTPPGANYTGTNTFTVTVFSADTPTDADFDNTNNTAQDSDTFDITWAPTVFAPDVDFNAGNTNIQISEDGSADIPVTVSLVNPGAAEFLTATLTGFDPSLGTLTASVGTVDPVTGIWTVTLAPGDNLSVVFTITPNPGSDIDFGTLQFSATANDPAQGTTTSDTPFNVTVDAVADAPTFDVQDTTGDEGTALAVNFTSSLNDTDGSEAITHYQVSGLPAGFTFNGGTDLGGGLWQFTPAEFAVLTVTPGDSNFAGTISLTATAFVTDTATDIDFDMTNNTAQTSDTFDLTWNDVVSDPIVIINNGNAISFIPEDGSLDIPLSVSLGANPGVNEFLTVTLTGIDPAWGSFSFTDGAYDATTGTWTVTLPAGSGLNTVLSFAPNANSDIDLSGLTLSVTATDPDEGLSTTSTTNMDLIVDAIADAPNLSVDDGLASEGQSIAIDVTSSLNDLDGSESITMYQISGVPAGFTFNAGTDLGGGIWQFTAVEMASLTIQPGNSNFAGTVTLTATAFSTETPTDADPDLTNNTAQTSDTFDLTWTSEINAPSVSVNGGADNVTVNEDGSVNVTVSAALGTNPNANEFLTVTLSGLNDAWGTYTFPAGGTYNAAAGTWTITLAAGTNLNDVITFAPAANSDVDLSGLTMTVTATDPDAGLTSTATDTFNVIVDAVADAPTVNAQDETALPGATVSLDITSALSDTDGSESFTGFQISGVPSGFSFNAGTNLGGGVWQFTAAQFATLSVTPTAGYFGSVTFTATAFTAETPTDGEPNTGNNTAQGSDTFTVTWDNPTPASPVVVANDGNDNIWVNEDGSVNVNLSVSLGSNASPNEYLTVTVSGLNSTWGTYTFPAGGTYNAAAGTWTITLPAGTNLNDAIGFAPAANSDVDLTSLNVTATATNSVSGQSASGSDAFSVLVDAVADAPNVDGQNASGEEGTSIPLSISASLTDSSESLSIRISGVPSGMTLSAGTHQGGGVWLLTPAQLSGLSLNANGAPGTYTLTIQATSTEGTLSGQENTTSNNSATSTDTLTLTVTADDVPDISGSGSSSSVDESNLGASTSANGTVTASFGNDGPGSFYGNGSYNMNGLTSGGHAITVSYSNGTYTGTANGTTVFTLQINNNGNYTFTLYDAVDHPGSGHNDSVSISFGVVAEDSEGDTDTGAITIEISDDGPNAVNDSASFGQINDTVNGNVLTNDDAGADGSGRVTQVHFGNTTVNVPGSGSTTIEGNYGTLTIRANGTYTYDMNDEARWVVRDSLSPVSGDVAGSQFWIANDGNTIGVRNGTTTSNGLDLSWENYGYGSGIGTSGNKVNGATDYLYVGVDKDPGTGVTGVEGVRVTLADIHPSEVGRGIDFLIYFSDGTTALYEYQIGTPTNGLVSLVLDSSQFGYRDITGFFVYSASSPLNGQTLAPASFLLNNIEILDPNPNNLTDTFTYTLQDGDGDTDTATLTITAESSASLYGVVNPAGASSSSSAAPNKTAAPVDLEHVLFTQDDTQDAIDDFIAPKPSSNDNATTPVGSGTGGSNVVSFPDTYTGDSLNTDHTGGVKKAAIV